MKNLFTLITIIFAGLILAGSVQASGEEFCQTSYGSYGYGQTCPEDKKFTVNKLVQLPNKGGEFVENLTMNDPLFSTNQSVVFQIKVKNTGTEKLSNIVISDVLPSEASFEAGPGSYDPKSHTLTIKIESLEAGKEAIYFVNAKVKNPTSVQCPVNYVKVTADGKTQEDNAGFCIDTKTVIYDKPVIKKIPETGPASAILFSLPLLGAAGVYIRRKTGI